MYLLFMIFTINYFLSSLAVECMQTDRLITLNAVNTCMYMYLFTFIHPHNTQYNYAVSEVDNAMGTVEGYFIVVIIIGSFFFLQ